MISMYGGVSCVLNMSRCLLYNVFVYRWRCAASTRFTRRGIYVEICRRGVCASDCRRTSTRRRRIHAWCQTKFDAMSAMTSTSKAFRARLQLRENEVPILQMWAARNCALHTCFRSDRGTTVLIALRATPQTSASFARTIRNALRRTGVSTAGLRGHWLFLISEREAISVCVGNAELPPEAPQRAEEQRLSRGRPPPSPTADDSDARVVELLR